MQVLAGAQYRAEYRHEDLDSQTGPDPLVGQLHERLEAAGLTERDMPNRSRLLDELDLSLDADEDRFRIFGAPQLNSSQFDTRYLIPGILTAGQPGGLFGSVQDAQNVAHGRPADFARQRHSVFGSLSRRGAGAHAVSFR